MKTNINKYITLALLGTFTLSCSEDFLEVKPIATDNEAAFYLTMSDAELATTAAYAQFSYMTVWDRNYQMLLGSIASDDAEAGGEDYGDVSTFQELGKLIHQTTTDITPIVWGGFYKAISLSNKAIEKLPEIKQLDPEADAAIIDRRVAELKFIRAIHYFALTTAFGEVPLVLKVLGASEYEQERTPMKKIYEAIEKDLKEAIPFLPEKSALGAEKGRASKGAAKALLAKLYLYESSYAKNYPGDARFANLSERWGEALSTAEEVINSNQYKLYGRNGERYNSWRGEVDGFRYLWSTAADNGDESIFEVQNVQDGKGWLQSRGNSVVHWSGVRYMYNKAGKSVTTGMWGFNIPTQDLVNEFEPGDPRLNTTVYSAGGNDSVHTVEGWRKVSYEHSVTGYYQAKYVTSYEEFKKNTSAWNEAPFNTRILRYADILLVAAEAAVMSGNNAKALTYINEVRGRARNSGNTGVPADLTGSVTLDQVKHERRVELAMEGQRFFDLVRWNDAFKKLNGFVLEDETVLAFDVQKHSFFPIPQKEIDASRGKLKQYGGW